jgi:chromosome segregation protein
MILKKIEIFGFKSFADKTVVELEPGITSIVGPNGCGKSNITDALRWALGEQSAKELRGSKMEDIIFNGTRHRKALGMSEVNVHFDNSQKRLPIEFSEVVITRRLYRQGDSEYFINKVPCRLKDITELIMDTGLGVDTYSVMGQGKMDMLLNSKPEERRLLFEEASGITKYKHRKTEALRKLDRVNENLSRISDIILELEKQIKKLDDQVKKVNQVKKLQEELKSIEVSHILDLTNEVLTRKEKINQELNTTREDLSKLTAELLALESELGNHRLSVDEKEKEVSIHNEMLYKMDSEVSLLEEKIKNANEFVSEYNTSLENKNIELLGIERTLEDIAIKRDALSHEQSNANLLNDFLSSLNILEEKYRTEESAFLEKRKVFDESKLALLDIISDRAKMHNELVVHRAETGNLDSQIERHNQEINEINSNNENISKILNELQTVTSNIQNDVDAKIKTYNDLVNFKNELEKSIEQKETEKNNYIEELHKKKSMCETLKNLKKDYEGYAEGTRQILKSQISGILGTVADILDVDSNHTSIIESVFGSYLNYVIVDNNDTAYNCINHLRENKKGVATFIVLDKIKNDITHYSIPKWLKVRDEKYTNLVRYMFGQYQNIENNNISSEITISGGDFTDSSNNDHMVLGREKKISDLEKEISEMENVLSIVQNEVIELKDNLQKNILESKGLDDYLQKEKIKLALNFKEIETQKEVLDAMSKKKYVLNSEVENLNKKRNDLSSKTNNLEEKIKEYELKETSFNDSITHNTEELKIKETYLKEQLEFLNAKKIEYNELKNREDIKKLEQEQWRLKEMEATSRLHNIKSEIDDLKSKIMLQEKTKEVSETNIKTVYENKKGVEQKYKDLVFAKDELLTKYRELESVIRNKKRIQDDLKDIEKSVEMNLMGVDNEYANLMDKLTLTHNLTYEEAKTVYPATSEKYSEEKIKSLKKRIESYGELNLAAPSEYQELEQRFKFLDQQKQDLVNAKSDLNKLINEINHITKDRFRDTFYQVKENFKQLFTTLFEGGEADLILTSEEDLLESGVDIMVQPPGKKLQNISLMSGGERALVAIAILFSFYMIKPSPFCILDEIDAPLDDVNLKRFTQLLRQFAGKSQFLIVTHNKKTMEMADVLYGVTMEEFGISKLISVKFQKEGAKEKVEEQLVGAGFKPAQD